MAEKNDHTGTVALILIVVIIIGLVIYFLRDKIAALGIFRKGWGLGPGGPLSIFDPGASANTPPDPGSPGQSTTSSQGTVPGQGNASPATATPPATDGPDYTNEALLASYGIRQVRPDEAMYVPPSGGVIEYEKVWTDATGNTQIVYGTAKELLDNAIYLQLEPSSN